MEVMVIARKREEKVLNIKQTRLRQKSRFKNLGGAFEDQRRHDDELGERIGKFSKHVVILYTLFWREDYQQNLES